MMKFAAAHMIRFSGNPTLTKRRKPALYLFRAFALGLTIVSTGASDARARIDGVVGGCVRVTDVRGQFTDAPGSLHRADGVGADGTVAVPEVVIRFTFGAAGDPGRNVAPVYVRTDADGCYAARWTDPTRDAFPAPARMTVLWSHTDGPGQWHSMPPPVFSIRGPTGRWLVASEGEALSARTTLDRTLAGGDAAAAYLTAWEFFDRVVRGGNGGRSERLVDAMRGIEIFTGLPNVAGGWGLAPTRDKVLVAARTPVLTPWTVAHELGHLATWNAFGVSVAPLLPTDYVGLTWDLASRETERAAFLEGMASFLATAWMWERTATAPTLYRSATRFDFEAATGTGHDRGATPITCATVPVGWERPFCIAAALWDLFDAPPDDDDPITERTQVHVIDTLERYADGCPPRSANGCSNEPGPAGLNHNDFLRNAEPVFDPSDLRSIYRANGIWGGVP